MFTMKHKKQVLVCYFIYYNYDSQKMHMNKKHNKTFAEINSVNDN